MWGNTCGKNNGGGTGNYGLDLTNYPYLLYFAPESFPASIAVCVHACPSSHVSSTTALLRDGYCLSADSGPYTDDVNVLANNMSGANASTGCPFMVLPTTVLNHRCLPTATASISARNAVIRELNRMGLAGYFLSDLEASLIPLIIIAWLTVALGLCVNYVGLYEPHFKVMLSYGLSFAMSTGATVFLWQQYGQSGEKNSDLGSETISLKPTETADPNIRLFLALLGSVVTFGWLISAWVFRGRIGTVWALYTESARSLGSWVSAEEYGNVRDDTRLRWFRIMDHGTLVVIGLPFITYGFVFGSGLLCLWTVSNSLSQSDLRSVAGTSHIVYDRKSSVWLWFVIVAFTVHLITLVAIQASIVAHAVINAYFSRSLNIAVWGAAQRTFRYHLGSCVCGSIVTLLASPLRVLSSMIVLRSCTRSFGIQLGDLPVLSYLLVVLGSPSQTSTYANQAMYSKSFFCCARNSAATSLKRVPLMGSLSSTMWFSVLTTKLVLIATATVVTLVWFGIYSNLQYGGLLNLVAVLSATLAAETVCVVFDVASGATLDCIGFDIDTRSGQPLKQSADSSDLWEGSPYYCAARRGTRTGSSSSEERKVEDAHYADRLSLLRLIAREERRFQSIMHDELGKQVENWMQARNNYNLSMSLDVYQYHEASLASSAQLRLLNFDSKSFKRRANVKR